jgi:hypothetical protein
MPNISFLPALPPSPGLPPFLQSSFMGQAEQVTGTPVVVYDELASLAPMWLQNGPNSEKISFPWVNFQEGLTKDLAIHKYPNLDGARIENMGSNPEGWVIKAIFTNHIDPDKAAGENWLRGTLFPGQFYKLLQYLRAPGSKLMNHPLYGPVPVQVVGYSFDFVTTGPRDGAYIIMNLIRTQPDNGIPQVAQISVVTAGSQCNNAIQTAAGLGFPGPPGLSLSQMFGQIASTVQNVLNYPAGVVQGVQDATLPLFSAANLSSNVAGANGSLLNASNGLYNSSIAFSQQITQSIIASGKMPPLGSPFNPYPTVPGVLTNTTSSVVPLFPLNAMAQKATQSLLSLNNNVSKDGNSFISKAITATYDTINYYISLNRSEVSSVISALQQMMYSLQQTQAQLSSNTNYTNVTVQTYLTSNNISWIQLSKTLNNNLDDLFSLNSISDSNYLFVPTNNLVNFYQSNGTAII